LGAVFGPPVLIGRVDTPALSSRTDIPEDCATCWSVPCPRAIRLTVFGFVAGVFSSVPFGP
jgi:hypothetical protein